MTTPDRNSRTFDWVWIAVVAIVSTCWIVSTSSQLGATFDEPFYIQKGLERWKTGSYRSLMRAGTMPLPVDAQTLPLHGWERFRGEPFDPHRDLDILLPVARAMNLPFWWALLGFAFQLGRFWGGPHAGRIALGLVGFDPNLLAHAALATTDIAITAAVLGATSAYLAAQNRTGSLRLLLPGFAYGVALLCKASAMLFVPMIWLILGLTRLGWPNDWPQGKRNALALGRELLIMGCVGFIVLFAYVGSDWSTEPSFIRWSRTLPESQRGCGELRWIADHLAIFPNAAEGLIQQIKHNIRGHGCAVLGEWHPRAVWYYFPVVLSVKLAEPLMLLGAAVLLRRWRDLRQPVAILAGTLLLFSLTCRVQIGIRLIFPAIAFLILAVAVLARHWPRLGWLAVAGCLAISWQTRPDWLKYQNHFWGDPQRAGERLVDSNFDWGQDLPRLKRWWQEQGEPPLHVWYYGGDRAVLRPPFRFVALQHDPHPSVAALHARVGSGVLAVSASHFHGCPDRRPETQAVIAWLKTQPKFAEVGVFSLYRFDSPPPQSTTLP